MSDWEKRGSSKPLCCACYRTVVQRYDCHQTQSTFQPTCFKLTKALLSVFCQLLCMDEYEHAQLSQETLLFVVTSTFGNGESPENGASFSSYLKRMKESTGTSPLKNLR